MASVPLSLLGPSRKGEVEDWPWLEQAVPRSSNSLQSLHDLPQFRHHAGVNCIPVLTCHLHQGLIAHGEHLTSRCQGWTDDMTRQRGWAPGVA